MRPPVTQLRKSAERFLTLHAALEAPPDRVPALLLVCAEDLIRRFGLDEAYAQDLALAVWAELRGRHTRCAIELELSSPYLLFIVDHAAGVRRPVPIEDLIRFLGPRLVHDAAAPGA